MELEKFKQSVLSGMLIGIGVVVNIQVENRYIGAMLFSLALLTIIKCDLKLFTGKIGFIGKTKISDLIYMFIGNLVGIYLVIIFAIEKIGTDTFIQLAENKFSNTPENLFCYGLLCGILMFIAVYCKQTVITIFCIMTFILSGWEHCIADFPYLCYVFSFETLVKYICIVFGNSVGAMFTYVLIEKEKE